MAPAKVAYWPGCVSRGFTTELHGSMALVAERPGIDVDGAREHVGPRGLHRDTPFRLDRRQGVELGADLGEHPARDAGLQEVKVAPPDGNDFGLKILFQLGQDMMREEAAGAGAGPDGHRRPRPQPR